MVLPHNTRSTDPNTLANTLDFVTKRTKLDYELSFERKVLEGTVEHELKCIGDGEEAVSAEVWLDSSWVEVSKVVMDGEVLGKLDETKEVKESEGKEGREAGEGEGEKNDSVEKGWKLEDRTGPYGSRLRILLGRRLEKEEVVNVKIHFQTTSKCTALGWMDPEQTSNKQHAYMYSQCQAIHCRSLFPCQDTPAVKSTYHSIIRSPLPVVVSGLSLSTKSLGVGLIEYEFEQKVAIPSYLYAIASGDITSARIGPRSAVWTSPDQLERCTKELDGDTEKFIEAAEKLIFPYEWETYNVLVLPPSFPYGGMENPNMTFATPTIISGDKSNIDVIAHELAHSWSGNLVTNANWEHFWLNEGWTTYLERRIIGAIHGDEMFHFSAIIGWKSLNESIKQFGPDHEFTKLVPNLHDGGDPDDAFSSVPYEKGFNLLYYLETLVGREKWDKFIPHYFETFRYKSLTTPTFLSTLTAFFQPDPTATKALSMINWPSWLSSPGLPPISPSFNASLATPCYLLAEKWSSLLPLPPTVQPSTSDDLVSATRFSPSPADVETWSTGQIIVFLEKVSDFPDPLTPPLVNLMDGTYRFSESGNAEVLSRFYTVALLAKDMEVYEKVEEFLGTVGRMKFVRPLYSLLNKADRARAVRTYIKYRGWYHPICRESVRRELGLE
ncbi:leukotriene A-4 hydrolase [Kalaharituber pfeilii]|nr:leukotriene A-4 hydrolase [Kalaharituber pfeilii]